jgi:hypothetical protein
MAGDHVSAAQGIRLPLKDHFPSFETVDTGMPLLSALIVSTPMWCCSISGFLASRA